MHVLGMMQYPLKSLVSRCPCPSRSQLWWQTGVRQSWPCHSLAHVHWLGAVQLPPFPHVCLHIGTEQLVPNHPGAQVQVSGAEQTPPVEIGSHSHTVIMRVKTVWAEGSG